MSSSVAIKQSFDYEQIAMSFHEAGHTIVSLHNYMLVYNVNIMTPKNMIGNTDYYIYFDSDSKDEELIKILAILELQSTYAGLVAEKMYYKDICGSDKFPMHLRIGSSTDIEMASKIITKNKLVKSGRPTYLFKKQVQQDVEQLLIDHWDGVRSVAHSLYKKKKLTHDELKYLLTRKTEHKDFWKNKFKQIKFIHNEKIIPLECDVKDILLENAIFSI